jgi:hypothetical protein
MLKQVQYIVSSIPFLPLQSFFWSLILCIPIIRLHPSAFVDDISFSSPNESFSTIKIITDFFRYEIVSFLIVFLLAS